MKNVLLSCFIAIISTLSVFGQGASKINYQALIKDKDGVPMANHNVQIIVKFEVGGEAYDQTIDAVTDAFGVVSYQVGGEDLAGLKWSEGGGMMSTSIQTNEGMLDFGSKPIAAVPFAFYALNSGSSIPGPAPAHQWEGNAQ